MRAEARYRSRRWGGGLAVTAGAALLLLAACTGNVFGPMTSPFPGQEPDAATLPSAQGEVLGKGPVRVAMLLPLSGDSATTSVGTSMANAARIAISYIESNTALPDNISIVLKDTGSSAAGAAEAASQAIAEGASLILGPLRADQVTAAGSVAKTAGIPVIGFSNNSSAASPGVYLLNVLPDTEVRRSLSFVQARGRTGFAAIFPATDFGRVQQAAFGKAVTLLGITVPATYTFASEAEARTAIQQLVPLIQAGQVDALFIPDRSTAPSFGVLLQEAGIATGKVQIIGSADWNDDSTIANTLYLAGAVYPATDDAGFKTLSAEYTPLYGRPPHAFATLAYTAVVLANASSLALGTPRYAQSQLTIPAGFNGRDGVFRFLPDGRSDYSLVMKEVIAGGSRIVDTAKL